MRRVRAWTVGRATVVSPLCITARGAMSASPRAAIMHSAQTSVASASQAIGMRMKST